MSTKGLKEQLDAVGFCLVPQSVTGTQVGELRSSAGGLKSRHRGGARNLLHELPVVAELATAPVILEMAEAALGGGAFAVRALFFDKSPEAHWKVPWHQDTAIAVSERIETPGYTGWSVKDGVPHVHPPVEILDRMIALRVHLDDCGPDNGPLRVLPGSHRQGKLSEEETRRWRQTTTEVNCCCAAGDVLVMRPLLLHASSPAVSPSHRRVIHIEFANVQLPPSLRWFVA